WQKPEGGYSPATRQRAEASRISSGPAHSAACTVIGFTAGCPTGHAPSLTTHISPPCCPGLTHIPVRVLGVTAVPLRETVCGLPAALSVNVTVPVRLPVVFGASVTLMAQLAPAVSVAPQVLVSAKFALTAILVIVSGAVPVLVSVMSRGSLVEPSSSSPKVKLFAEKATLGDPLLPLPQPLRAQNPRSTRAMMHRVLEFMVFFSSASWCWLANLSVQRFHSGNVIPIQLGGPSKHIQRTVATAGK